MLSLENISISYHGHEVVHDVSLEVAAGEVIALIGPSGAGKSSLLRTVNYLERPSKGTIRVAGHTISANGSTPTTTQLVALRKDVGMVFQGFNLFPHLTALQNIELAQTVSLRRNKTAARARGLAELAHVGLSDFADRLPGKCSGGQQQRIAIARALALDPQLMLFDEPTSALDPELGVEVLNIMRRLAGEGMTMVIVTHEMHFAEDVADRVVFMADGAVVEEGASKQVLRDPQHERTQKFLRAVLDR
ncbi:amino acid ABC transporter ATP-binding protein [Microbacterium sp. cx-59]|nr:amino acid ABC transporter ATP-binding protein [Microbacterium sp. cx-59]